MKEGLVLAERERVELDRRWRGEEEGFANFEP